MSVLQLDQVVISNMALSHIGERDVIEAVDEITVNGSLAALWYDFCRVATLEAFDWSFARRREALAPHNTAPDTNFWQYRYTYPADAVTFRGIHDASTWPYGDSDEVPYELETTDDGDVSILTDCAEALGKYTRNVTNPALFSSWYSLTLSRLLAHFMAMSITGKEGKADKQLNLFRDMLVSAPSIDAMQGVTRRPRNASWTRARR